MELRQLRYASELAKTRNFSRAAENLYITQQTLSQQIRRLEEELGFSLFVRSTRSVALTDKGAALLRRIDDILSACDALEHEASMLRENQTAQLRLGILPTFSHLNVLETIHEFQAYHPSLSVSMQIHRSGTLLSLLLSGRLDAAISNISEEQTLRLKEDYILRTIARDRVCVLLRSVDRPPEKNCMSAQELSGQRILLLEKGSSIRARITETFAREGIRPGAVTDCLEIQSMVGMVRNGLGIGFLSSRVADQYLASDLCSVPLEPIIESVTFLLYPKNSIWRDALDMLAEKL